MTVPHVVLVTLGSLGDVLPKVAIAEALWRKGAAATIVTYDTYAPLIRRAGAGFRSVPGDPRALLTEASDRLAMTAAEGNIAAYARTLEAAIQRHRERAFLVLEAAHSACVDADVLVYGITSVFAAASGEALGRPTRPAFTVPFTPTDRFAAVVAPVDRYHRPAFTKASHRSAQRVLGRVGQTLLNEWRTIRLGLPPLGPPGPLVALDKARAPILYGFSPHLIPPDPTWPPQIEVTGAWRAAAMASDPLPPALEAFLAAGPPPVVIGFSSMIPAERARLEAVVSGVIRSTRYRFVVLSGWMDLTVAGADADRVLTMAEAPHDVLLPRAAALMHTGGAGAVHAQLAARIPGVTLPHSADSYFWTRRLVEVGRAIEGGPASAVTVETLRAALDRCLVLPREAWPAEPNDGAERAAARLLAAAQADVPVGATPTRRPALPP